MESLGGGGTWKAGVVGNHGKLGDLESIGALGKRGGTVKNEAVAVKTASAFW